jgi:hypothetical protein
MPMNIPVGQGLAVLRWSNLGDPEEQITTFGLDERPEFDAHDTAVDIYGWATSSTSITSLAAMNQGWTFNGVTFYLQGELGTTVGVHNAPITAVVGGLSTLPTNCSLLVQKHTALSGRRNRGRFYVPAYSLSEGDINPNGVLDSAFYTTLQNRWDVFYDAIIAGGAQPVLFHSIELDSTPITSFIVDIQIATQRRRMR